MVPPREIYLAGTGTFAAEVAAWAHDAGIRVLGLVELEDESRVGTAFHGLGAIAIATPAPGAHAVVALGGDRRALTARLTEAGWQPAGLVHPSAQVATSARIDPAATIGPHCVVGAESVVGPGAILNRGALVGHHVNVGEYATLNPGVNVGGNTSIGRSAFIGIGATIVNGTKIGSDAVVAAGALVLGKVAPGTRVQGVPAREFEP